MPRVTLILSGSLMLAVSASAEAYLGPALGLGIIGTVISIVVVLLLSLFAFIFVPIRRMFGKTKQKSADDESDS